MVAACLTIYFVTFLFIGRRPEGSRRRWRLDTNVWLLGLLALGSLRYAFDYERASRATQLLVPLAGIVLGQCVSVWARWRDYTVETARRGRRLLCALICVLAGAALRQPSVGTEFQYRGEPR